MDTKPLTVIELHEMLTLALSRGLNPATTVVLEQEEYEWVTIEKVIEPTVDGEQVIWFTLIPGRDADERFDDGHYVDC